MGALSTNQYDENSILSGPFNTAFVEFTTMFLVTLDQQPLANHSRAAQSHFLGMIADNRRFWQSVENETDDNAEWVANARQHAATGHPILAETSASWLLALDQAEAVLTGALLLPHWRLRPGTGINLHRLLQDPPPIGFAQLVHGTGLEPIVETGTTAGLAIWQQIKPAYLAAGYFNLVHIN
ncbi:MAG: hypothetical protein JKX69_08345 [Rhodobacteraceae bacterium]|nr:hypothetical protein [Paracoccaceae bacterium]